MADLLESLEIETAPNPDAAVVWMHGLGADGHDFEPIVPELRLPATTRVRFVFPHAPLRPVTINQGHVMRAWYDIRALAGVRREDEAGVRQSARQIEALLARERQRGIAPGRLVVAGFSQGGATRTGSRGSSRCRATCRSPACSTPSCRPRTATCRSSGRTASTIR
jgi:phospholipase/carboxylesterase